MPRIRRTARRTVADTNGGTVRKSPARPAKRVAAYHVWDAACQLKVFRASPPPTVYPVSRLEPGVNYFVLMLEQLGATTHYSCEGHPNSFYVMFEAPVELAERIVKCGYLVVELEGHNLWSLRINRAIDEAERVEVLRGAAETWDKTLGPLECLARPKRARTKHHSRR